MDLDMLKWLKDIDLYDYLGLVAHEVRLNKDMWDRQHCSDIMERGMRNFKCNECKKRAVIVNFKTKRFYCDAHQALMDSWNDDLQKIEDLWIKFERKLSKIEKMLILIQERELYLQTSKNDEKITDEEKKEIQTLIINIVDTNKYYMYST